MPFSFPASPTAVGQTSTQNGRQYVYAGNNTWELVAASGGGSLSGSVTIPGLNDPDFSSVSLLLHFDGNLTDSSSAARTVTAYGNAAATGTAKFGSASLALDGSGDYVSVPSSVNFDLGTSYTVECWIRPADGSWNGGIVSRGSFSSSTSAWDGLCFSMRRLGGDGFTRFYFYATTGSNEQYVDVSNSNFPANTWTHVAMVRSGTTGTIYANGAAVGTVSGLNANAASSADVVVGRWNFTSGSEWFNGQIDDVRITKGIARAIAVPTSAFPDSAAFSVQVTGSGGSGLSWSSVPASATATGTAGSIAYDANYLYVATAANTWERAALSTWETDAFASSVVFLMHADGTLADSSTYARTVTPVGSPTSTGTPRYGSGALALNGSGDYFTVPSASSLDLGSNYTLEAWIYPNSSTLSGGILHRGRYSTASTSWDGMTASIRGLSTFMRFYFRVTNNSDEQSVDVSQTYFPANTWTHVAMVRSGTSGYVFAGGQLVGTISSLGAPVASTHPLYIGTWEYNVSGTSTFAGYWNGSIDEIRISTAARYTSAFTPPTAAFLNP